MVVKFQTTYSSVHPEFVHSHENTEIIVTKPLYNSRRRGLFTHDGAKEIRNHGVNVAW